MAGIDKTGTLFKTMHVAYFGLVALLGLLFFLVGVAEIHTDITSKTWPVAPGIIVSTDVRKNVGRQGTHYCPGWVYTYLVNGRRYANNMASFDTEPCFLFPVGAENSVAATPAGKAVDIIYNPRDPAFSAMHRTTGNHLQAWFFTIMGAFILYVGCYIIYRTVRARLSRADI